MNETDPTQQVVDNVIAFTELPPKTSDRSIGGKVRKDAGRLADFIMFTQRAFLLNLSKELNNGPKSDTARVRARFRLTSMAVSAGTRQEVRARASGCCEYCLCQADYDPNYFTIDHVLPRSEGGSDDPENLAFACCDLHPPGGSQSTESVDEPPEQ